MNRVVVSIPRVLDSAMVVTQDHQCEIDTGDLPTSATAPFTVTTIKAVPTETQMHDLTVTPLNENSRCSRVTAKVTIPLALNITDHNGNQYQTHSSTERTIDIILYIPNEAAFPYQITCEAALGCQGTTCEKDTTTLHHATCKILVRVTAVTDLLIPTYGYAPLHPAENYYHCDAQHNFLHQPLFPTGKVY